MVKKWMGVTYCDFCGMDIREDVWFVDGKTTRGPWAVMCRDDYRLHGLGLGYGRGQKYNGKTLEKIEG